jgi:hypothetical protein
MGRRDQGRLRWLIGALARETSLWSGDVRVADSTPVECARSRETVHRSELAGWAGYGDCAKPLPLLLRTPFAPDRHPAPAAGRLRRLRRQGRRTLGPAGHPRRRPNPDRRSGRPDGDRGEAQLRAGLRGHASRRRHHPAARRLPQGAAPLQHAPAQAALPGDRAGLRPPKRPARPLTERPRTNCHTQMQPSPATREQRAANRVMLLDDPG